MRHTVHADFALRLLTYLAVAPGKAGTVAEIAKAHAISRNHLLKVANRLVHAEILVGMRGRRGGLTLAKDPAQLTVGTIIRASEEDFALVECMGQTRFCRIVGVCRFRNLFNKALAAYFSVLDEMTLADAVKAPDSLRGALGLIGSTPKNTSTLKDKNSVGAKVTNYKRSVSLKTRAGPAP
jgi:Rrf2 family transcriptional regulator, nitric oxide-sensitive transcriptional repressor